MENQEHRQWMQPWALTLDKTIDHAARWHGKTEIISRTNAGAIERTNYSALRSDARRMTNALLARGIVPGDRIGTLAMNGGDHLAAWFGIMGMGAICHTLNPRLSDKQLAYIIGHARDRLIFADRDFQEQIDRIFNDCPSLEGVIYFDDRSPGGWRDMLSGMADNCTWGDFAEDTPAGLCYTSGTTGRPKGVVYTHRSNYLHTLMVIQPDVFNISARDSVLLVVPMFHANAWGLTFAVAATGAKAVLPGARLDGASLYELMETEGVTITAGVPTVWQTLLGFLRDNKLQLSTLRRVLVGGAACPESLFREFGELGVQVQHNWGMTESSPLGTTGTPTAEIAALPREAQLPYRLKQGRAPFGVDVRTVDASATLLPRDGNRSGVLQIRGHSIVQRYFGEDHDAVDADGYFDTGDIASIDEQGFVAITDRAKDIIKSGGEWISSSEMEAFATAHPAVGLAAAIGVPHPKWGERPLLLVQLRPGGMADADGIRAVLAGKLVRWALPDAILFVDEIPLGATGKIDKKALRERYAREWRWPADTAI